MLRDEWDEATSSYCNEHFATKLNDECDEAIEDIAKLIYCEGGRESRSPVSSYIESLEKDPRGLAEDVHIPDE